MTQPESTEASFSDQVRGTTPQSIDLVLPSLLQDLYATAKARDESSTPLPTSLPEGWNRLTDEQLLAKGLKPSALHDPESGFDAAFYQDASGNVVLGFCGTDELRDWPHNVGQGLGIKDAQYDQALDLARKAKFAFGDDLILTGHSLGGGLAAAAAMTTDTPAVTYNAAGVNDRTLEREDLDPQAAKDYAKDGLIRGYHVKNEILTHLQEDSFPIKYAMPDAAGHQIELPDPDPLSTLERLVPGKMLVHRLDLHGIESVMQSQSLQQLRAQEAAPAHPGHARSADDAASTLVRDAVGKLGEQRERLGLQDDARFLNAATGLAAQAGADGMSRIDHLVPDARGGVFAVQGRMDDPAHQRSHVDATRAAQIPAQHSVEQLRDQSRAVATQQQDVELQQRQAPRQAMA
jgi:hypothetical protein